MRIQPIVVGTAGHIDHGKSTLVRALTGVDPDRLKEEKERGLTIDLGFAPLELPDGRLVGIVDVPGHERFIRNMVAGASGVDLVVLVVAADDGVMPQTREHLHILQLLGVAKGLIALTKIDAVDPEMVGLATEEVRECVAGTFLEDAPVLPLSAKTGEGVEALRDVLVSMAAEAEPRTNEGVFRMPVQRVFSKAGFGTVVTGIPVGGEAGIGDVLEVLPGGWRGKVRGLNAYRNSTDRIRAGHSSAINLTDVDTSQVRRGCVVATPNFFAPQLMVAARLEALVDLDRPIVNRTPIRLHTGTADPSGELVLLDSDELGPGASGLVQLRLHEPIVCAPGDRFVLRRLSPVVTLGGGTILEESRHRLKRFRGFVLDELAQQEASLETPRALLESLLHRRGASAVTAEDLSKELKQPIQDTARLLEELVGEGRVVGLRAGRWVHVDPLETARARVRQSMATWFDRESHRSRMKILDLRKGTDLPQEIVDVVLDEEAAAGRIEAPREGTFRRIGDDVELDADARAVVDGVLARLQAARFQPPTLVELAEALGTGRDELGQAFEHLVDRGDVEHVSGELFLATEVIEEGRRAVTENCERNGHLEIPELRDRLGTTRKFLIPLLEHFDGQGLTIRQGAHRILRRR